MRSKQYDPQKAALLRSAGIGRKPNQVTQFRDYGHAAAQTQKAKAGTVEPLPGWSEVTFETPGRSPHPVADVVVPLLQAVVSGCLAGGGVALGVAKLTDVDPVLAGGVSALAVTGLVWSTLLADSRRLLRRVETWVRQDLDGDGKIGKPEPETVRLEMHTQTDTGQHRTIFSDVPVDKAKFKVWVQGVVADRSLALGSWTGSKGPFSRSEYDELMAFMDRARVVEWNNPDSPRSGRKLTTLGRQALAAWLEAS
jgi:hypothetical protein